MTTFNIPSWQKKTRNIKILLNTNTTKLLHGKPITNVRHQEGNENNSSKLGIRYRHHSHSAELLPPNQRNKTVKRKGKYKSWRNQTVPMCIWYYSTLGRILKSLPGVLLGYDAISQVGSYKINTQKSIAFLYASNKHTEEKESRKPSHSESLKNHTGISPKVVCD